MSFAHAACVAQLGVGQSGDAVNDCQAVCGAFLYADAAAVAQLGIHNGLLPLFLGGVLAAVAVFIEKSLIFADILAGTAVNAAIGVDLVLFFHGTGGCAYGADLGAFIAAITFICNFISHNKPPC